MRKWSYLIPVAVLGFLLAIYGVALAVAQAVATPPSKEVAVTAPQEWTTLALLWKDDNQKGLFMFSDLGGTTGAWSLEGPMGSRGADPLSGSHTSADVSATPLSPAAFLLGSGLVGLGLLGWHRQKS
jgi:hypothetical protein